MAAERGVEFLSYNTILAASDNDAYNTLVATDLAPEFGRESIWQLARDKEDRPRHALPTTLGGQGIVAGRTLAQYLDLLAEGWTFSTTRLTKEYTLEDWRAARPKAVVLATMSDDKLRFITSDDDLTHSDGKQIVSLVPPKPVTAPDSNNSDNGSDAPVRDTAKAEAEAAREKQK